MCERRDSDLYWLPGFSGCARYVDTESNMRLLRYYQLLVDLQKQWFYTYDYNLSERLHGLHPLLPSSKLAKPCQPLQDLRKGRSYIYDYNHYMAYIPYQCLQAYAPYQHLISLQNLTNHCKSRTSDGAIS